jgi:hypothetical protein
MPGRLLLCGQWGEYNNTAALGTCCALALAVLLDDYKEESTISWPKVNKKWFQNI